MTHKKKTMILNVFFVFFGHLTLVFATTPPPPNAFQTLFPEQNKLYTYVITTNVSTGTLTPIEDGSYWTLEGRLSAQVYDDFTRARFVLDDLKTLVHSKHGISTNQSTEAADLLKTPWEVGVCFSEIFVNPEPVWVTNVKRAISFNFLLAEPRSSPSNNEEPCLYGNCLVVYSKLGSKTRKYNSLVISPRRSRSSYEQRCLPSTLINADSWYRPSYSEDHNLIMTAERVYDVDKEVGLKSLELTSDFQYRADSHILSVSSKLTLHYESSKTAQSIEKLNLKETSLQYAMHNHSNPYNGIRNHEQADLRKKTYEILIKIARKGIDADNIVRNASLIHSLDFIELLTTMSQLNYTMLGKLFEDVLGTSYELETSKNIFLEVLPYVRTDACAHLVRYLLIEQKSKIEDAMLVSLIRKLPYNVIDYSRELLQELEVFTKLGPDFSQEIRHAGILSFATLVHKTMEASFDQQYYDDIYDKYLRMFNYCPQYVDRLVWLQGLTNIGKSVVNYLDEIHMDTKKDRHERLWAALASLNIWKGSTLENTLPILMNASEHAQLRVVALHAFLSTPLGARDFLNVHNYVQNCGNDQLKKFWYSTVKNLEKNRFYNRYKSASYFIPFVAAQVSNPGPELWATNNYIISQEPALDVQGPTFQLLTAGGPWNGPPEMAIVEFSTGGVQAFNAAVYIIAEGVTSNVFKRLQNFTATEQFPEVLLEALKDMKVDIIEPEQVHIDIVVKVYDKTVYATHINQARFDSWNAEDFKKTIEDFVRFGSHINQQIVYYPIQIVKNFPTEIGTPIRLQSTVVSFTSIRGNLTAPSSTEDLTWRNDLHIRYQGTSVTSLSTDGPLQPSEHTARIQQSMVAHLPIKFDISISPVARSLDLTWTNPVQNGGLAMHSRTEIEIDSAKGKTVNTVTKKSKRENEGMFFDCEHPLSEIGSELSQLLTLTSSEFLTSQLILKSIRLISSQTSGSCGLILPPKQLQTGNKVKIELRMEEIMWDEVKDIGEYWGQTKLKLSFALNYYRDADEIDSADKYLSIWGYTKLASDGRNGEVTMELMGRQPQADNPALKNWAVCIQEKHNISTDISEMDFKNTPISYQGEIHMNFSSGDENFACFSETVSSEVVVQITSQSDESKRYLQFKIRGGNLPILDLEGSNALSKRNPYFTYYSYDVSKDDIGMESGMLNATVELEVDPNSLDWLPYSWSGLQMMKKLGFYHECRIKGTEVNTFSGETVKLAEMDGLDENAYVLAAGDCSSVPRFAVVISSHNGSMSLNTGSDAVRFPWPNEDSTPVITAHGDLLQHADDFRISFKDNTALLLRSKLTGVHIYRDDTEMIILVPQAYISTACGTCTGQTYYKV